MKNHPTKKKLELFLHDLLSGGEAAEILLHLEDCDNCRNSLPDDDFYEVIGNLLIGDSEEKDRLEVFS